MNIARCRITQDRTVRLITSAHHKPAVLSALASTFGAQTNLEDLESVTSDRLEAEQQGVPGISPEAMAAGYGYTYINAAFAYTRPDGNRFNPREWGAWYASFEARTALCEVGYHLTRALTASKRYYDNTTRCVELLADFDAEFADLRGHKTASYLHPDIEVGYPAGQKLAATLREDGANGIVYPSLRRDGGTCLVAFWPGLIRNFQRGATWEFVWSGNPDPTITQVAAA